MIRVRLSSVWLKYLLLSAIGFGLYLQGWAGQVPVTQHDRNSSLNKRVLERMMIPGTQDLQLIVELSDPGVLEKMRGVASSSQTSRARRLSERNRRVDLESPQALAYRQQVVQNKESVKNRILQFSGAQVQGTTEVVMNTVIVRVPATHYAAIRSLPGVKKVYFSRSRKMLLDQAAILQNAQALWSAAGGQANAGKGIKIGLIDSGIDITNPMFSGSGMTAPSGFPIYDIQADKAFTNSKVIVARSYVSLLSSFQSVRTAVDEVGHGTFVAGCAAGQQVTTPLNTTIAGMAPGAYLGSYKIFGTPLINDTTTSAAIVAGIDDAVADGMDVISLSLGSLDYIPPADETDGETVAIENAIQAGSVVTIAVGNDGTSTHTIDSPGTTDDAIAVGSVTNSRELLATIQTTVPNLSNIGYLPSDGIGVNLDISAKVVDIQQSLDPTGLGCSAFPSNSLSGSIALIERGTCNFSVKGANAKAAGAKAVIVYNNDPAGGRAGMSGLGSVSIPVVGISYSDGTSLKQYIDSNPGTQVTIDKSQTLQSVPAAAPVISSFSSVGPSMNFAIKPDLVAVGENVYSSTTTRTSAVMYDSTGFTASSGTSFSTPMVAGAAAALRQHFPTLGPLAIKSLLTTTANRNVTVDGTNAANVLQSGSGLLNMGNAFAATAVFSPTSLSFGVHSYTGSFSYSLPLAIENISSSSDQFTLGVESIVDGASITFDQNSFSIEPGVTATINVSIQVTSPSSGGFQGFVTAKSKNTSFVYRIPYWAGVYVPDPNTVLPVSQSASGSGSYNNLADALAAAQPGNIIEIQDSATYSVDRSGLGLTVTTNSQGVPLHGITIRAAANQTPVVDGSNLDSSGGTAILIVGLQNVLLQGLTINGGYTGIDLYQPSVNVPLSVAIDQSTISNSAGDSNAAGILIDGGGVVDITKSIINSSQGTGIVSGAYADGTQLTVLNSTVQGNGNDGLDAYGSNVDILNSSFTANFGTGSYLDYCSGTVKGNTFAQNQGFQISFNQFAYGDGLQIGDGDLLVQNNLFDSNSDAGLTLEAGDQTGLGPTAKVLGNTMHMNGYYGIYSAPAASVVADGNLIKDNLGGVDLYATPSALLTNNIVVRSTDTSYGYGDGVLVESGSSARIINNTIYANALHGVNLTGGTAYIANSIVYGNRSGNLQGVPSGSYTSLITSVDPQLNNPASDDFSLKGTSPAIDTGSNSVSDLPFLDFSGRLRVSSPSGSPGQGTVDIGAEEANSQYPLIYPLMASESQSSLGAAFRTGIAFANPSPSSTAQVNLTAYNSSGSDLTGSSNPALQPVNAEGQLARLDYQLFGYDQSAPAIGSVLASSDSRLVGFDYIADPEFNQFATGASALSQAGTDLVFMRHESDSSGTASYVIFNPGINPANITATLYNTSGSQAGQQTVSISPKGQTIVNFSSPVLSSGYVRVQSDRPVSGIELVGKGNRQAALGGFPPGTQARLFFPHFAVGGGYSTQVGIVNTSTSSANLTLSAYDDNGSFLGSINLTGTNAVNANGQLMDTITDLFGIPTSGPLQTGYLIAQSDQPGIMGYTDYTYNDGVHNPDATIPADSVSSANLYFSHIAQGVNGYETGIALLNPFGTDVTYTINVYDGAGNLVAFATNTIGAHQKVAKILSYPGSGFFSQDLILGNGHVEVSTDYGLLGLELFFTDDLSQLASVPAQIQ